MVTSIYFVSSIMGRTAAKRTASSGTGRTVAKKAKVVATRKPKSPPTCVKKHTTASSIPGPVQNGQEGPASTVSDAVSEPTDETTPPKTTENSNHGQDTSTQSEPEATAQHASGNTGAEAVSSTTDSCTPPQTTQKSTQGHKPATHGDPDSADEFQDPSMQPVVYAGRVNPRQENEKLKYAAEKRQEIALKLLETVDFNELLQTAPTYLEVEQSSESSDEDDEKEDQASTKKTKGRKATESRKKTAPVSSTNNAPVNSSSPDGSKMSNASVKKEKSGKMKEQVVGSAIILNTFDTNELRKEIHKTRKRMNYLTKLFYDAYRECLRYRNEYYDLALKQTKMSDQVHMRETLKVTGRIERPFNVVDDNLLHGKKLRSGQLPPNARPLDENEQYDFSFKDYTHDMLRNIQRNASDKDPTDDSEHHHKRRNICMLQTFEERCYLCGKYFQTKRGLNSHLTKHTDQFYKCTLCSKEKQFTCEAAYKNHLKWHAKGEIWHYCPFIYPDTQQHCGKKFEFSHHLDSHTLSHYPPSKACRVHKDCAAIYTYESERKKHETKGVAKKIFECTPCGKKFKDFMNRKIHMLKFHHPGSQYFISPAPKPPVIQRSVTGSANVAPAGDVEYGNENTENEESSTPPATNPDESINSVSATGFSGRTEENKKERKPRKQVLPAKNLSVNDPNLAIPMDSGLDISTDHDQDTTRRSMSTSFTTGSEYEPNLAEEAHAYDSDSPSECDDSDKDKDYLPDV